jgi:hypothetical protein
VVVVLACGDRQPPTAVDKIEDLLRQMESKDSGVEPDVISFTQLLNAWRLPVPKHLSR